MFEALLTTLARAFDNHRIPYMVIGGQAVLLYGEARLTADVDVTLGFGPGELATVQEAVHQAGLQILVPSPEDFVKQTFVLPCAQPASGIRVDVVFSLSPFERQAVERARSVTIAGTPVRYATKEDLVVTKLMAGRPRDMEDVRSVLLKQPDLDVAYVRRWLRELQHGQERDVTADFEHLWNSTRGPRK